MDITNWLLILICLLAGSATIIGFYYLSQGKRSNLTFFLMITVFILECNFLYIRGEQRGKCPLSDWAEILLFISWSLTMMYLLIGPTFRISLLGFFSAPFITALSAIALIPGVMESNVTRLNSAEIDPWGELHAAMAVMSYGAFALAMIASVMFLALNQKLKNKQLAGGLFKNLPPVNQLTSLSSKLLILGIFLLTIGIASSFLMRDFTSHASHLWTAIIVWVLFLSLISYKAFRGIQPKVFSILCCILFFASLIPFALL